MLFAGTRNEELAGRVGGVNERNAGTNHDGLLMEVAVAKVARINVDGALLECTRQSLHTRYCQYTPNRTHVILFRTFVRLACASTAVMRRFLLIHKLCRGIIKHEKWVI